MRLPAVFGPALLCGAFLIGTATAAAGPASPDAEQVRGLVQQLDDTRFPVRRDADRSLRQLGVGVVPLLRQELEKQPSLEVARRIESIIDDLSQLKWHANRAEALRVAAETGRPMLVFATVGKTGPLLSRATKAMQLRTFNDLELVEYLNTHFVLLWENLAGVDNFMQLSLRRPGPTVGPEHILNYEEGMGGEDTRTFFCTSDGKVVHQLGGFWKASRYLTEARFARELLGQSPESLDTVRAEALRRQIGERIRQLERSAPEGSTEWRLLGQYRVAARLLSRPVLPILDEMSLNLTHC